MPLPGSGGIPTTGGDGGFGPTEDLCAEYEDFDVGIIRISPGGVVGGGFGGPGSGGGGTDSAPAEPEPDFSTLEDWPIDVIDETTEIARTDTYMLTGQNVSEHLSSLTPGCIDTDQIETVFTTLTEGFINNEYGWEDFSSIPEWASDFDNSMSNAVAIMRYNMSVQYVDPEIGIQGIRTAPMYAHASPNNEMGDPTLNVVPLADADADPYGNRLYEDPFVYAPAEHDALEAKFGCYDPSYDSDAYRGTMQRLEDAMTPLVDAMQTGYTARANITRTTPHFKVSNAVYEKITSNEVEEIEEIAVSVGTTRQASTTTTGGGY